MKIISFSPPFSLRIFAGWLIALALMLPRIAGGQTLTVQDDVRRFDTLANTIVVLDGKAELHFSGTGDPMPGCTIHLNSPDAWLFLHRILPSQVVSTFLGRIKVDGSAALLDSNVRVVQHENGAVVIPHGAGYSPMEVFEGKQFAGISRQLKLYTYYNDTNLGPLKGAISSFRLKRGYMATIAQQENGTGFSKVYIAQDSDLEVGILPASLENNVRFVRVFPWRWTAKKGWGGGDGHQMRLSWQYDWGAEQNNNSLDTEYVPMRHGRYWPGYDIINAKRNATHVLGFNEPDRPDQANMSVEDVIAQWPELMKSGLRLGAPAVSDGGLNWLYAFIDRCDELGYRVDFVPVHFYRAQYSAWDLHEWLRAIHERTGRPIWLTEFNNGANWTCCEPSQADNAVRIGEFIDMMGWTPFVERYAIFNWVGDNRRMVWDGGSPLPAGQRYRDHNSPLANFQELPDPGTASAAYYLFEGNLHDSSGNGHNSTAGGVPTFGTGKFGQAASFDGSDAYMQLSPKLGDSTDFSFGAWVWWNGGGNWQRIFDLGDGTERFLCLSPKTGSGTLRFTIKNGGAEQQLNAAALVPNVWTHVAVTISGNTGKLFVNGALANTNTGMTINPAEIGTRFNYLGKSQFADPLLNGRLDEVRFLATALTDAQVAAMASGTPPRFNGDTLVKPRGVRFQPYTGSIAADASGSGALTFSKLSGPAWLAVAANGRLTGVPGLGDGGENRFLVRVSDVTGAIDTALLTLPIADQLGLTARYSFNGTVNSAVGGAHGVASGSPSYVGGRSGSAIDLDGTDDSVRLPHGIASEEEITVATWVHWDGGANWQRIFDFGNGTGESMFLTPRSGGNTLRFSINSNSPEQFIETTPLATGQWVHVAVTLGAYTGRLYVNGVLVGTKPISLRPSDLNPASNYLGKSQFPDPLFNGRLDEFLIFNRALTGAEVAAVMNGTAPLFTADPINSAAAAIGQVYEHSLAGTASDAGGAVTYSKVSGPSWLTVAADGRISGVPSASDAGTSRFIVRATDASLLADDAALNIVVPGATDLLAHYQLDGNSLDSTGGPSGVTTGAPVYETALFDRALRFDGVDDFVRLPAGMLNGTSDITLAARVRWNGGGNWQRIFDFGNNTTQYMLLTPRSAPGTLRFTISVNAQAGEQILETSQLVVGEWTHVAVTLVGNTGTLYVNGAAVDSRPIMLDPASFSPIHNFLGKAQFAADPLFNGLIDEVRIYRRGLAAAEIQALAIPPAAVVVPDASFTGWAGVIPFPAGEAGPAADPDRDGVINSLEYLFGTDPLAVNGGVLFQTSARSGAALGGTANPAKTYLTLQTRVRRNRPGVTLLPEAASNMEGLWLAGAASRVVQSGAPVADGEFEILTYYYDVATEDSPTGTGFIRLRVLLN